MQEFVRAGFVLHLQSLKGDRKESVVTLIIFEMCRAEGCTRGMYFGQNRKWWLGETTIARVAMVYLLCVREIP